MTTLTTKEKSNKVGDLIRKYEQPILDVLPDHIKPERAMRVLQTACTRIPKLLDCSQSSLLTSMVTAAEFDLEPNTPLGQCYIIPYGNQASFQMGYQGMIELAYRTTVVTAIRASDVRKNDTFDFSEGTTTNIHHTFGFDDRGPVIGYYAVVEMKDGTNHVSVMSKSDALAHGKQYSKAFAYANSGWQTAPDAMCKKTCIIQALKYAPKSIKDKAFEALIKSCYSDQDNAMNSRIEPTRGTLDPNDLLPAAIDGELLPGGDIEHAPKPNGFGKPTSDGQLL